VSSADVERLLLRTNYLFSSFPFFSYSKRRKWLLYRILISPSSFPSPSQVIRNGVPRLLPSFLDTRLPFPALLLGFLFRGQLSPMDWRRPPSLWISDRDCTFSTKSLLMGVFFFCRGQEHPYPLPECGFSFPLFLASLAFAAIDSGEPVPSYGRAGKCDLFFFF